MEAPNPQGLSVIRFAPVERKHAFRLRILRLCRLGLPQNLISERLDVSEATMSRWMDANAQPRADHLDALDGLLKDLQAEIQMDYDTLPAGQLKVMRAEAEAWRAEQIAKRPGRKRKTIRAKRA